MPFASVDVFFDIWMPVRTVGLLSLKARGVAYDIFCGIYLVGDNAQMLYIATGCVAALMVNDHVFWDWSYVSLPDVSMNEPHSSVKPGPRIASFVLDGS